MATYSDRVSDTQRAQALDALGYHFAEGRLTLAEYEYRADQAMASYTDGELQAVFMDLPVPHHDRGLEILRQQPVAPVTPAPQLVAEYDPMDQPIGNSIITPRKIRRAGWILSLFWMLASGPLVDAVLPTAMVPFVMMAPVMFMVIVSVILSPNKKRYRQVSPSTYDQGNYPY